MGKLRERAKKLWFDIGDTEESYVDPIPFIESALIETRNKALEEAAVMVETYWQPPYAEDLDAFVFGKQDAPEGKMARHLTAKIPKDIRAMKQEEDNGTE